MTESTFKEDGAAEILLPSDTRPDKKEEISFWEFYHLLTREVKTQNPNTKIFVTKSGDYLWDNIMELREGDAVMEYSPYQLYNDSRHYRRTLDKFINKWNKRLNEAAKKE